MEIHSDRLILRPYGVDDLEAYTGMVADPVVMRFLGAPPLSTQDAWARLLRYIGHWSIFGFGPFAVFDRMDQAFVGETGFMDFRRDIAPKLDAVPEALWLFTSAAHGKGYAFEAADRAHRWLTERHAPETTQCIISPENMASIRLAEKLGYRLLDTPLYGQEISHRYIRSSNGAA